MRTILFFLLASFVLAGCPSSSTIDGGEDVPSIDAPAALDDANDAPLAVDARPADAPSTSDAPLLTDAPSACEGLAGAACLGTAGCVPTFDDSCCPTCRIGPCADCTNPDYLACRPVAGSPCGVAVSCGTAPDWACDTTNPPTCAGATVLDVESCSVTGCVPAFPSSEGAPDLSAAVCTPMLANSCTVACRRVAPVCPTGTRAEGDGSCYTDRCIPTFVCQLEP